MATSDTSRIKGIGIVFKGGDIAKEGRIKGIAIPYKNAANTRLQGIAIPYKTVGKVEIGERRRHS